LSTARPISSVILFLSYKWRIHVQAKKYLKLLF